MSRSTRSKSNVGLGHFGLTGRNIDPPQFTISFKKPGESARCDCLAIERRRKASDYKYLRINCHSIRMCIADWMNCKLRSNGVERVLGHGNPLKRVKREPKAEINATSIALFGNLQSVHEGMAKSIRMPL